MRPFNVKLVCCIGLFIVAATIIIGCGSGSDLLDEVGYRYTAHVTTVIDGEEETSNLDIGADDCDLNASTPDDDTLVYSWTIALMVEADENTPDLRVNGFTVTLTPIDGLYEDDATGDMIPMTPITMPAQLGNLTYQYTTPLLMQNGSIEFTMPILWSPQDKFYYLDLLEDMAGLSPTEALRSENSYTVHIVLHCSDKENNTFDVPVPDTTVSFWDVWRC